MEVLKELDVVFVPHLVVIQLLENLSRTGNKKIREILDFLALGVNIRLQSAGFKEQVKIRNITPYYETAATVAIGKEQNSLIVLGNPKIDPNVIEKFAQGMIRVTDLKGMVKNPLLQTENL